MAFPMSAEVPPRTVTHCTRPVLWIGLLVLGVVSVCLSLVGVGKTHLHIAWEEKHLKKVTEVSSAEMPKPLIQPTLKLGPYNQQTVWRSSDNVLLQRGNHLLPTRHPKTRTNKISQENSLTVQSIDNSQTQVCAKINLDELQPFLKSQSKEDKMLLHWFNGLCRGTYLEMGALNGVTFSNSYVFNQKFNWTGVLIEANPQTFKELQKNRPHELSRVNAKICSRRQTTSGIWEFATERFRQKWWPQVKIENTDPLECVPLREILQATVPDKTFFDFFSLDVEGAEYEVLTSLNFSAVAFGIIIVEQAGENTKTEKVRKIFDENGYHCLGRNKGNEWFMHSNISSIYPHVFPSDILGNDFVGFQPTMHPKNSRISVYKVSESVPDEVQRHSLWGWYARIKKVGRISGGEFDRKVQQRLGNTARWEMSDLFEMKLEQLSEGFTYFENLYFGGQFALDGGAPVDFPSPLILFFEVHERQNRTDWDKHASQLRRAWGQLFFNSKDSSKFPGVSIGWKVEQVHMVKAVSSLKQANNNVLVLPGLSVVLSDYMLFMAHYFHFQEVLMGTWAVYQTYAQRDQVKWVIFPNSQACKDYTPLFPDLLTEKYTCEASWRGKGLLNEQIIAAIFPKARVLTEVEIVHLSSRSLLRLEKACVGDRGGAHINVKASSMNKMLGGMTVQVSRYQTNFLERMKTGFGLTSEMIHRRTKARLRVTIVDRGETASRRIQQHVKNALLLALNLFLVPQGQNFRKDIPPIGDRLFLAGQVKFQDFPYEEQLRIAMTSDVLIGRHGNGLTHALFMPVDSLVVEIFSAWSFAADYQHLAEYAGHRHFAWDEQKGFIGRHDMEKCHPEYYRMCGEPGAGVVVESLDVSALVGQITASVLSDIWPPISQDPCPVPNQCKQK